MIVRRVGFAFALAVVAGRGLSAQGRRSFEPDRPNVPYDGRFTFVRIKYTSLADGLQNLSGFGRREPEWHHDYPSGERNFSKILDALTTMAPRMEGTNILPLDDPELFKYPVAYLCEPGFWNPNDKEVEGLRAYLKKGGFLIIDDFVANQLFNFEAQMRRVLPEGRLIQLTAEHPIFDSFYKIPSLEMDHPYYTGYKSIFYGIFEDNDPTKRLMVIVNYNNDIGEYWEFSDTGMFPIDLSNEAYKLGVNYVIYALTR